MNRLGFSYKFIAEEGKFKKLAIVYHVVMVATLYSLLRFVFLRGKYELFDVYTFEISKVSFRWMMGVLAAMMASCYAMSLIVVAYYKAIGSSDRMYQELAMLYGFLSLLFFSVNLFGFWGIVWLPVSPPIAIAFLGLQTRTWVSNIKRD